MLLLKFPLSTLLTVVPVPFLADLCCSCIPRDVLVCSSHLTSFSFTFDFHSFLLPLSSLVPIHLLFCVCFLSFVCPLSLSPFCFLVYHLSILYVVPSLCVLYPLLFFILSTVPLCLLPLPPLYFLFTILDPLLSILAPSLVTYLFTISHTRQSFASSPCSFASDFFFLLLPSAVTYDVFASFLFR